MWISGVFSKFQLSQKPGVPLTKLQFLSSNLSSSILPVLLLFSLTFEWQLHFSCHLPRLPPPLTSSLPSPEGVNCRVGRALVQAPGWQGPCTLSFTQDRLIYVLWGWEPWRPDSFWIILPLASVRSWGMLLWMMAPLLILFALPFNPNGRCHFK